MRSQLTEPKTPKASAPPSSARAPSPTRTASAPVKGAQFSTLLPGQAAAPAIGASVAAGEIDLSRGTLALPEQLSQTTPDGGEIDVNVKLPGLAQGALRLRRRGETFSTVRDQAIDFRHPALSAFSAAHPTVLALHVVDNTVTGWIALGAPGPVKTDRRALFAAMSKAGDALGWVGLSQISIPTFLNKFENGAIEACAERINFTVGGFLTGSASAALDSRDLTFEGNARVQVGPSTGELQIKKGPGGVLAGKVDLQVGFGRLAGTVTATLTDGFVAIMGSVAYVDDRMNGKVTLVATDEATARDITLKKPEAGGEVPIELPGPDKPAKPGRRAFCGWGQLTFHVTDWLAGAATVIINSKGQATIVGEIAPPKEFILFEQKEWVKRILKLEIRAGYGIPVVGQVAIFANVSLDAIAKIGPGKLYQIKLTGAYSTDPRVAKQLTIEGTLNISAFAGLRARAEAGLVVTILAHDIKAGVGLDAIAGVRGYVEATPRIGMREPVPGKREYFIQGHLEIAAQPVLGFGGDLFVAIETPWWSPLSDKRWTWPLFSLEYPLPGEFGVGADVDYVLGSKQWPKIEFGEVNFDASKFLTDVMNDNTDKGSGGEQKKQGEWKEGAGGGGPGGAKNKGGKGKNKEEAAGDDIGPIGEEMAFSDGRQSHRLWIEEKGADTTTMLASEGGKIEVTLKQWSDTFDLATAADAAKAKALLARARVQSDDLGKIADNLAHRKQAAKNARAYYEKYKNSKKGPKGDKSKKDLKKAKAEARAAQRALERTVEELAKIIVMMPFIPVVRPAFMHGGGVKVEIVAHKLAPAVRVDAIEVSALFPRLLGGPIGKSVNKAAERLVRQAWNDINAISGDVGKVRIRNGQVNVHAYQALLRQIGPLTAIVSRVGRQLRIENLLPRGHQAPPLKPPTEVNFPAYPKSPGDKLYSQPFVTELRRQLRDQQRGLNQLTVDRWFFNLALFKADDSLYRQLDKSAREGLKRRLKEDAEKATQRTQKTLRIEENKLDKVLAAVLQHQVKATVIVSQKGMPDRSLDLHYTWVGENTRRLVRAKQRQPAAQVALAELMRAEQDDETPIWNLIRQRYPGLREQMALKVGGRGGGERAARKQFEKDLQALLVSTREWWKLASDARELAILHRPDQVAGGFDKFEQFPTRPDPETKPAEYAQYLAKLRKMFGPANVNSKIGSDWSRLIQRARLSVEKQVVTHEAQPINRLNFRLNVQTDA